MLFAGACACIAAKGRTGKKRLGALALLDAGARELMLFAAVGLLIGGLDELAVDLCFWAGRLLRRQPRLSVATLPPAPALRFAVFVPAWDEAGVIGPMLRTLLDRWGGEEYRVYVGTYPNDAATAAVARTVADARVRVVVGPRPGPTTKADNLNALWHALAADDWAADAIIVHDAEDVVHPAELRVFGGLLAANDVIQLPVLPIVGAGVSTVSAVYGDEFAESHTRLMTVRAAIGAGLPLAGTGCCLAIGRLKEVAVRRGGLPFDADSLVEDYELGLDLAKAGARGCFARVRDEQGALVAVRAIFPATLGAAIRQKSRWIGGIAFAGWDRTGWARAGAVGDHWMRGRDRRAPLAMLILTAAYLAGFAWGVSATVHWATDAPPSPLSALLRLLLNANLVLLGWRLLMRMAFTGRVYGAWQALLSIPRFVVGNLVALAATPRALLLYLRMLRGAPPIWEKTDHVFPDLALSAAASTP